MSEEEGDGAPVFVLLGGRYPSKYFDLTIQTIKFLKRSIPKVAVGIITPPGSGDLKGAIEEGLRAIDSKLDVSNIWPLEGKKHFDNWNNSQYILDILTYAEEYDPVVFLDAETCVLRDLLPYVETFKQSGKNFAFLRDSANDYPNFIEKWEGGSQAFFPQKTLMIFRAAVLPDFISVWENTWKEWITPAPFVLNNNNPAPFYKKSSLHIYKYALAQSITRFVKNFDEEVSVIVREDLKICRNYSVETEKVEEKFLLAGSPFGNENV